IERDGAGISLTVRYKNVGRSPAQDTVVQVSPVVVTHGISDYSRVIGEGCGKKIDNKFGTISFPGEEESQNILIGMSPEQLTHAWRPKGQKGGKLFNTFLVVCATYKITPAGHLKRDIAIYDLEIPEEGSIPQMYTDGQYDD
ncbi:MAG TPA: hypothetical protein VLW75_03800, partial [Rhizomicrobium sp.]|nr:hypothetical protein [Rhizomicrobium sp.]